MPLNSRDLWLILRARNLADRAIHAFSRDVRNAGHAVRLAQLEAERATAEAELTQNKMTEALQRAAIAQLANEKAMDKAMLTTHRMTTEMGRNEIAMLSNEKATLRNQLAMARLEEADDKHINTLKRAILVKENQIQVKRRDLIETERLTASTRSHINEVSELIVTKQKDLLATEKQIDATKRHIATLEDDIRTTKQAQKDARIAAEKIADEADKVARRRNRTFWTFLFTPNRAVLSALRTGVPAVLSSPIGVVAILLAATFAASFVGALGTVLLTAGLGGVFLAAGSIAIMAMSPQMKKLGERLVETLKKSLRRAVQPLAAPITQAMKLIEKAVVRLEPTFRRIFSKLAPLIRPVTIGLIGLIQNAMPGFERSIAGINAVFLALGKHLPRLGTAIGDFFAELTKDPKLLERVTGLLITWVNGFLKVAGPLLEGLMVHFAAFANMWRGFILMFRDGQKHFAKFFDSKSYDGVKAAWKELGPAIGAAWQAFRDLAKANTDQEIIDKFKKLAEKLGLLWDAVTTLLKELWNWAWGEIKKFWKNSVEPWLKQKVKETFAWILFEVGRQLTATKDRAIQRVKELVLGVVFWFLLLPIRIAASIASIPGRVGSLFVSTGQRAIAAIIGLPGRVASIFSLANARIIANIVSLPARVGAVFANIVSRAVGAISSLQLRVGNIFFQAARAAVNQIRNLPSIVGGIFGAIAGRAFNSGYNIIARLAAGIRAAFDILRRALSAAASMVANYIPGSPVKTGPLKVLNRGYAGGQIVRMLAGGIRSNRGLLARELNRILLPNIPARDRERQAAAAQTQKPPIIQNFYITTQEIDPRVHAASLGFELSGRL